MFMCYVGYQSQASWFVLTGKNFVVDAHNQGGIDGNGQVGLLRVVYCLQVIAG